jgi:hypothetical protein
MPLSGGGETNPVFTVKIGIVGIARAAYLLGYENTATAGWDVGCNPASREKKTRKRDHAGFAIKMVLL